ncbi:MAG TPA: Ig-like domain-containing protein [Bryobacteraceae bacterium]|nr:Ig-like domain-containing protein [Bryobacteraceae bacterium]
MFTRSAGAWTQQGPKLVGSGALPSPFGTESAVALSADGNTAVLGSWGDDNQTGATWIFTRIGGVWSQQSQKLVGTGAIGAAAQGFALAVSADGNTALVGGLGDNQVGAVWVFTRSAGAWSQQGNKLTIAGATEVGCSVALSSDGNTALIGGLFPTNVGTAWLFSRSAGVWTQLAGNLVGSDEVYTGTALPKLALSQDGSTALLGWITHGNNVGATYAFIRSSDGWSQQGPPMVGSGYVPSPPFGFVWQGNAVALSADGNTALVGGSADNDMGAAWIFQRNGGSWHQVGDKLVGTGAIKLTYDPGQGWAVALSADGRTALIGGIGDNNQVGAVWVFTAPQPSTTALSASANPSAYGQTVTYKATVSSGATGTITFTIDGVVQSTIPLSGSVAQFSIANLSPGSHAVVAAYNGDPTNAPSTSNVITQTVNPLGVISLWANTVVNLSGSARVPVSVASPAPAAGLTIYLTSSDPSKVTVPPSVFIPAGRTSPSVQPLVTALNLGTVSITASALGYTSATQSVYVEATLTFAGCCVAIYGPSGSAVLTLSAPAPQGGLTIQLVSDNPKVATVPPTITFPAYMSSVNVPITRVASGMAVVHASDPPYLPDTSIRVTMP